MTRSLQTLLSIPKRAVVRLAYHVVALLVTCARWIAHQWKYRVVHTSRGWLWYRRRSRGGKGVGYAKGQRPKDPRVLGVVLFQRSFRAQEDQALSRLLVWAAQQGFILCTLYCPYDGVHVRMDSIKASMKWSDVKNSTSGERSIRVWDGWDAPSDWIDALEHGIHTEETLSLIPMGVALLNADHAEAPLTAMISQTDDDDADSTTDRRGALEKALQAPCHLKEMVGKVAGKVATMDPDIIMIFGGISSLGGYPSWSTRSSEIYDMGPLGVVTRGKLDAALKRYRVTSQRFGR